MGFMDALRRVFGVAQGLHPREAKRMLDERSDVIVLDVRQAGEYRGGHLRGAKHAPVGLMAQRAQRMDASKTYLVYCRSGSRSNRAASVLASRGFKDVYNLRGGIVGWEREGFPVQRK